jgi:gamma-glutamyltranspeptidase/glutathione hydrolase
VLDARGRVEAVAGASGGPRIISATVQALLNALVFGMPAEAAVTSPRFHHQWWPDRLSLEPGRFAAIAGELRALGHTVGPAEDVGVVQLVLGAGGGGYTGAADPRKGGRAAGR